MSELISTVEVESPRESATSERPRPLRRWNRAERVKRNDRSESRNAARSWERARDARRHARMTACWHPCAAGAGRMACPARVAGSSGMLRRYRHACQNSHPETRQYLAQFHVTARRGPQT